jgi:hypothetical protein
MSDITAPELVSGAELANKVSVEEISKNVAADKARAIEAIRKAKEELASFQDSAFVSNITGHPGAAANFSSFKRDQYRGIEMVYRNPFFYRVDTRRTMYGKTETVQLLVTKARDTGGVVEGDGWMVISWTAPIANMIQGRAPGEVVEFERGTKTAYEVNESAKYETLLPQFENAEFWLRSGKAAVAQETDLIEIAAAPAATLPPQEYSAKPSFGLSDIIVLVDEPQRAALSLPFGQSVIIEGPPGSGKTSVGLMRIAVLYDQQWEALKLQRDKDRAFHEYSSMQVLVFNQEMVEYLKSLAQSIGVNHVQVNTTSDFFRRICRETKMLSGTDRRDRPSLAAIKGRREALTVYFAGFRAHAARHWESIRDELRQKLFNLGPDFLALADRLAGWIERIQNAKVVEERIDGYISVADSLTDAANEIGRMGSPTRRAQSPTSGGGEKAPSNPLSEKTIEQRLPDARKLVETAIRGICSRAGITRAMFDQPEYDRLKEVLNRAGVSQRTIEDGDRLWRKQYAGDLPAYSELDLAMAAWLGAKLLLSKVENRKPWIGGRLERLTHIVIDEAQDLSSSHLTVLASQLDPTGTLTLVGDLHQNLNPHTGLRRWEDSGVANIKMSSFGVNHRQTQQLGEFLVGLHAGLFGEVCTWKASPKTVGLRPRAGVARSWNELAYAVATEAALWREKIIGSSGATVAVLYDGKMQPKRLDWLKRKLEIALSDQLIAVEVATPESGGETLRRTDRVLIASVRQTKGLEFDAVIFIEPRPRWAKAMNDIDLRVRNGFYVATSRARAGLSMCMSNLPSCIESLVERGLCELITWTEGDVL